MNLALYIHNFFVLAICTVDVPFHCCTCTVMQINRDLWHSLSQLNLDRQWLTQQNKRLIGRFSSTGGAFELIITVFNDPQSHPV